MHNKASIEIYHYWNRLRGNSPAPMRAEIDPGAIRYALPDLFILADRPDEPSVFRLAGTRLCGLLDRELREESFAGLWIAAHGDDAATIARDVMRREVPVFLNVTGLTETGRQTRYEMLLLPMRSSQTVSDRILGALIPDQPQQHSGIERIEKLRLDRSHVLGAESGKNDPVSSGSQTGFIAAAVRRLMHLHPFEGKGSH